mgnify:CR=1 FL=1
MLLLLPVTKTSPLADCVLGPADAASLVSAYTCGYETTRTSTTSSLAT